MKPNEISQIFPEDMSRFTSKHREREYTLLDVRLPQEYAHEHIPGARLIPLYELESRLGEIEPDQDLLIYCRSGKRSMAGAVMARDSGLISGQIFNLEGGIAAYTGKTLPDYPRIHFFYNADGVEEVLKKAISLEKGAYRFYLSFRDQIQEQDLKQKVQRLADLETKHARVIFRLGKDLFRQDFDGLFQAAGDDLVEGGLDVHKWSEMLLKSGQDDLCSFFLELALEMETMAYDMYRNLAAKDLPGEVRDSFYLLAEQEKSHMRLVARMFRDCSWDGPEAD